MKPIKLGVAIAALVVISACGTTALHSGDHKAEDLAHISGGGTWLNMTRWGPSNVNVLSIDNQQFRGSATVLPGTRTVTVEIDSGKTLLNRNIRTITFEAKAGQRYVVRATLTNKPLIGYGGTTWVWVDNETTNKLIAGAKPPE